MKKITHYFPIAFIIITCLLSFNTYAQDRSEQSTLDYATLKEELKLSNEQVDQLDAAQKKHEQKVQKVMKDKSKDQNAKKEKIVALNDDRQKEIKEILSEEQFNKLKELHEKSPTSRDQIRSKNAAPKKK